MQSATSVQVDQSPFIGIKQRNVSAAVKYDYIEYVVQANSPNNQDTFPTKNFLRMKQIVSIDAYTVADMGLSPSGVQMLSSANAKLLYFNFYGTDPDDGNAKGDWMGWIPFCYLHRVVNGVDPYVFAQQQIVPRNIVWDKSEWKIQATGANPFGNGDTPVSIVLVVGYLGTLGD